ncbi:MAG: hypothetical protein ACYCW6_05765 [Candidatus Xenobia bacterium]
MQISSVATPVSLPRPTPEPSLDPKVMHGRDLADDIKGRSTLVGLVEPVGVVAGLATHPGQTWSAASQLFGDVVHHPGNIPGDVGSISKLAMHPTGIPGIIYNSGVGLSAAVTGVVGGVELYEGIKNHDKFYGGVGAVDLASASSGVCVMVGQPIAGVAVSAVTAAARLGLVFAKPKEFSRIQKAQAVFTGLSACTQSLMQASVLPGPATFVAGAVGTAQILYFNVPSVRNGVNHAVDWFVDLFHHKA